mgnify:CR=1 FL=1
MPPVSRRASRHPGSRAARRGSVPCFNPFPVFEGEWQAPQEIVFNDIALAGYKIRWFPKIICYCEYLNDGITNNRLFAQKMNHLGYSLLWKSKVKLKVSFIRKLYCVCQSGALALYSGKPKYIWIDNNHKVLSTLLLQIQ